MLLRYYNHLCNGRKCFRHDCEKPQYVDCLHPPEQIIRNGKLDHIDGIVYNECRSCRYKRSKIIKKELENYGSGTNNI